jgi:probable HAF family extracellular repeat protein
MKPRKSPRKLVTILIAAAAAATLLAESVHAGSYRFVNLGTIGGTQSGGNSVNARGWASGFSTLIGDATQHATLWINGATVDLGTLGGDNSGVEWLVHNDRGQIAGISETGTPNPYGEIWSCGFFFPSLTHQNCRGFVWQDGVMTELPTLGGDNGYAAGMNDLGQIAGWAETTFHDPTCNLPQVLQFEAVVYGPGPGEIHPLPPFSGDPDGAATAVNDRGQVVGISGLCANAFGGLSAKHALLWENGEPIDIGNLGGQAWNTPTAINQHGDIVGFSDLPNDDPAHPNYHAFLWTKKNGIRDLGTLPGDVRSQALGINNQGQVVGLSVSPSHHLRAFLWQDGVMSDLNDLIPAGSPVLLYANDINDSGEITGEAFDPGTGDAPAFLLVPSNGRQTAAAIASRAGLERRRVPVTIPEQVRRQVARRFALGAFDSER